VTASVLAQLAALKTMHSKELKGRWRELFETEPPPYNRRFLESRLAYRIQELAFGGLNKETLERLRALGEQFEQPASGRRRRRLNRKPIAGTVLLREWKGIEYRVVVRQNDFEYDGRRFQSLSAVARTITGTQWNGWAFFGLGEGR
jgi:hypothetical protein